MPRSRPSGRVSVPIPRCCRCSTAWCTWRSSTRRSVPGAASAFGPGRVLGGVAYVGAVLQPDGSIRHVNRLSGIAFGERGGGVSERARAIEQLFANTPVSAPANDKILQEMWEKFVMMGAMAGMNCLMRGNIGEIMGTQDGEALMLAALAECRQVAEAAGYPPRPQARERVE